MTPYPSPETVTDTPVAPKLSLMARGSNPGPQWAAYVEYMVISQAGWAGGGG